VVVFSTGNGANADVGCTSHGSLGKHKVTVEGVASEPTAAAPSTSPTGPPVGSPPQPRTDPTEGEGNDWHLVAFMGVDGDTFDGNANLDPDSSVGTPNSVLACDSSDFQINCEHLINRNDDGNEVLFIAGNGLCSARAKLNDILRSQPDVHLADLSMNICKEGVESSVTGSFLNRGGNNPEDPWIGIAERDHFASTAQRLIIWGENSWGNENTAHASLKENNCGVKVCVRGPPPPASSSVVEISITHVSGFDARDGRWALIDFHALDEFGSFVETSSGSQPLHSWLPQGAEVIVKPVSGSAFTKIVFVVGDATEAIIDVTWADSSGGTFHTSQNIPLNHASSQPLDGPWSQNDKTTWSCNTVDLQNLETAHAGGWWSNVTSSEHPSR
jgi:hypothetical protein